MKTVTIQEARRFSLEGVQTQVLGSESGLVVSLLCFEAGQQDEDLRYDGAVSYQVLEGEAILTQGGQRQRLGKGKLLLLAPSVEHRLENAGGGLLVVMATRIERASDGAPAAGR